MRRRFWAAACAAAWLAGAPALAADDGWTAFEAKRYADAVRLWIPAAEAGDSAAQFRLGVAYDLGQGVAADPVKACEWYRRAGAAGQAAAAFNAAVLYDSGRCGSRRPDLAALWYARAAGMGHGRAQFDIAQMYAVGDGVPRNPEVAAAWFRAAAANGISAAVNRPQPAPRTEPPGQPIAVTQASLDDMRPAAGGPAVLVWTAPPQSGPVRFFVEVAALRPEGPREVLARYVEESAVQVTLPADGREFAWRVLTVGNEAPHYAAAPWQLIQVHP